MKKLLFPIVAILLLSCCSDNSREDKKQIFFSQHGYNRYKSNALT